MSTTISTFAPSAGMASGTVVETCQYCRAFFHGLAPFGEQVATPAAMDPAPTVQTCLSCLDLFRVYREVGNPSGEQAATCADTAADMDPAEAHEVVVTLTMFGEWEDEGRRRLEQAATTPALGGEPPLFSSPSPAYASAGHVTPPSPPSQLRVGGPSQQRVGPSQLRVGPSQPRKKGFTRTSTACLCCKKGKRVCTPSQGGPACVRCVQTGTVCEYPTEKRTYGRQKEAMERAAAAGKPYTPVRQARAARKEATCSPRNA